MADAARRLRIGDVVLEGDRVGEARVVLDIQDPGRVHGQRRPRQGTPMRGP
jgi:hypothetical protein